MSLKDNRVAVHFIRERISYPRKVPFDPPENYPEYTGHSLNSHNQVYSGIRDIFYQLQLDRNNFNTKNWNPLGGFIKPGMTVFLKPNTVIHKHEKKKDIFSLIVHASVLRAILDYVCIALKTSGKIVIGDSQEFSSHFDKAMARSGIKELLEWYADQTTIPIECIDLRLNRGVRTYLYGKWGQKPVEQDPKGYQFVDLGDLSLFKDIDPRRLRLEHTNHNNMYEHHSNGKHEYLFPKSFLESDVVISIPKLKTHHRTGVTLALKNFMGLPSLKDSLPHWIAGSIEEGGDQYIYPSLRKRIWTRLNDQQYSNPYIPVKFMCSVAKKIVLMSKIMIPFKENFIKGMYYGNDTVWRTLYDLSTAVFCANKNGIIQKRQQRSFFCIIDGIIAGEKNGPLEADPVRAGVLIGGSNPVAVDAVGATVMGFDIDRIPLIAEGFKQSDGSHPIFHATKQDIRVINNGSSSSFSEFSQRRYFTFEPHPRWKGHVEIV